MHRRVELSSKLALAHALLATGALIGIHLADIFSMEKIRQATILDIATISLTVSITIAYTNNIRGYTCPDRMHQSFFIKFAYELQGIILRKYFK
jgi:hypothetical protein